MVQLHCQQAEGGKFHSNNFLFIKSNKKSIKVKYSEILFIEGLGDYIKIQLNNEKLVTYLSINSFRKNALPRALESGKALILKRECDCV